MSLEPTLLQQTLTYEFHSFPVLSQSKKESHANLSSYSVPEKGDPQTTTMLNEAIINDACYTSAGMLEFCSMDLTQHLLISVRRRFCFYDFTKLFRKQWNKKRWNFQYRLAFFRECGGDEGGISREFYSGKTMSGQLCFKFFALTHYFHKSNFV